MAGGDTVDLIYTANWCYYKEQVEKAGFMELTEDFLNTYMPQTMATLPESAWKETYWWQNLHGSPFYRCNLPGPRSCC